LIHNFYFLYRTGALAVLISTDFDIVRHMGTEEYESRLQIYDELMPQMSSYIRSEAARKVSKLPVSYVGVEDLVGIGNIGAWVAVLRWDGSSPLIKWAKRLIWTRMNLTFGYLYRKKRTARVVLHEQEITSSTLSLQELVYDPPADLDPVGVLIAEEMYSNALEKLLRQRSGRLAAGVLRLLVYPDRELLRLCELYSILRRRHRVRVTNFCMAERLGVSIPRVVNARILVRRVFKEL